MKPNTPFEPPAPEIVHAFLPGPGEWLPGHVERYHILENSREYSCRIVPDEGQRYMVCTRTPSRLDDDALDILRSSVDAVKAAREAYSQAISGRGAPLVWEMVGPLIDTLMDFQNFSRPEAVVVGRDTHTGLLFAHLVPEFMSFLLWRGIQETGKVDTRLLRAAMGFDKHYRRGEKPVPGARYRVHGDIVMTVHRYYESWAEAAGHLSSLLVADETARRLPHALFETAKVLGELLRWLEPQARGSTSVFTRRVEFACPLDAAIKVSTSVSIVGLGLRYSLATRYYVEASPGPLAPTYTVLDACDPMRESCGSPSAAASRLATLLYSEAVGGANAVFPQQMTITLSTDDSMIILGGPALLEVPFNAAYLASLATTPDRPIEPVGIEVEVGNHRVAAEGVLLRSWLLESYSKLHRLVELASAPVDSMLDLLVATARMMSIMVSGDVTLLTTGEIVFEHEEHGTESVALGPALVNISTLSHPTG